MAQHLQHDLENLERDLLILAASVEDAVWSGVKRQGSEISKQQKRCCFF
jgi:hypothetical protein